jgi:hypothetical protein
MITAGSALPSRAAAPAAARTPTKREPPPREAPPRREPPPMVGARDEIEETPSAEEAGVEFDERPRSRAWPPSTDSRQPADPRGNERGRAPAEPRLGERDRPRPSAPEPQLGGRSDFAAGNRGDFAGEQRRPRSAPERPKERAEPRNRGGEASTTVVRSGIIHGMAYTLYADGSIEAELPIGTVRFASIDELQDHVSRTGDEADVDFAGKPTS